MLGTDIIMCPISNFEILTKGSKFMSLYQIALTGGPCAGKSSALKNIKRHLEKKKYKVIVVEETATESIMSGIPPWEVDVEPFQELVISRSINKAETTLRVTDTWKRDVVIIYDRGLADCLAYMPQDMYKDTLKKFGLTPRDARDQYDLVIHMVTAADGAEEAYTCGNNKARKETPEQARELDTKTRNAWSGHHHLVVIDNSTGFQKKLKRVRDAIDHIISGEEYQRKWLIKKPSLEQIASLDGVVSENINQAYIKTPSYDLEERVRKIGDEISESSFSYSYKRGDNPGVRHSINTSISFETYLSKLSQGRRVISQKRSWFFYKHQYFRLDCYNKKGCCDILKEDEAILEIDLVSRNAEVILPDWVHVIREVTAEPEYANKNLARELNGFERAKSKLTQILWSLAKRLGRYMY